MGDFGDRMKSYEAQESGRRFIPLLPVYARIDGRCFSRFTKGMERPYDIAMSRAMIDTTKFLVSETHALIGYAQSDEISLVWLQKQYDSEIFFSGKIQKTVSVLASMAAAAFTRICYADKCLRSIAERLTPHFDCRAFQLPSKVEAANVFLWREQDATKNAISMAARSFYSHKELHGKTGPEMQEMLWQKGQNFNDYPAFFKRGTFVRRVVVQRELTAEERVRIPVKHQPPKGEVVIRAEIAELEMPNFATVNNRTEVIFETAAPTAAPPEPR